MFLLYDLEADLLWQDSLLRAAIKLTANADLKKHSYFGYGIEFDTCSAFSLSSCVGFVKMFYYIEFLIAPL